MQIKRMSVGRKWRVALAAGIGLVLIGSYGTLRPPGLFAFAATDCSSTGDCASYIAPMFLSVLSIASGVLSIIVSSSVLYVYK